MFRPSGGGETFCPNVNVNSMRSVIILCMYVCMYVDFENSPKSVEHLSILRSLSYVGHSYYTPRSRRAFAVAR